MTFLYFNMNLQSFILNLIELHRYYESELLGKLYKRLRVLSFNSIYYGFSCTSFYTFTLLFVNLLSIVSNVLIAYIRFIQIVNNLVQNWRYCRLVTLLFK